MKIIIDIPSSFVSFLVARGINLTAKIILQLIVNDICMRAESTGRRLTGGQWAGLEKTIRESLLVSIDDGPPEPETPPVRSKAGAQAYCTIMREPVSGEEFLLVRSIDPLSAGSSMIGKLLLAGKTTFEFSRIAKVNITEVEG